MALFQAENVCRVVIWFSLKCYSIAQYKAYKVKFQDGYIQEYPASIIAENILEQVDTEGNEYILLQFICDHQKDGSAIAKHDMIVERTKCVQNLSIEELQRLATACKSKVKIQQLEIVERFKRI